MSSPARTLVWMLAFLALIGGVAAWIFRPLADAFLANAPFNGVIVAAFLIGVAINLRQVLSLRREVRWIEALRVSETGEPPAHPPRLVAPMAQMLSRRGGGSFSLSPQSMRSLLDTIRSRLDESRDISRYFVGLLVFLGLLGTFWGLLETVSSVSGVIGGLSVAQDTSAAAIFGRLKDGLEGPLTGMGIAFSSSLFGLAGSLVLGFLDLQAGHAQNRFYNELEEWLSGVTRLSSGALAAGEEAGVPAYIQALLEQTADSIERLQRSLTESDREREAVGERLRALSEELSQLNGHMKSQSRQLQAVSELHGDLRTALERIAEQGAASDRLDDDLRSELRLINRTLAAALGSDGRGRDQE